MLSCCELQYTADQLSDSHTIRPACDLYSTANITRRAFEFCGRDIAMI